MNTNFDLCIKVYAVMEAFWIYQFVIVLATLILNLNYPFEFNYVNGG